MASILNIFKVFERSPLASIKYLEDEKFLLKIELKEIFSFPVIKVNSDNLELFLFFC
jgi:hypothetical protein